MTDETTQATAPETPVQAVATDLDNVRHDGEVAVHAEEHHIWNQLVQHAKDTEQAVKDILLRWVNKL